MILISNICHNKLSFMQKYTVLVFKQNLKFAKDWLTYSCSHVETQNFLPNLFIALEILSRDRCLLPPSLYAFARGKVLDLPAESFISLPNLLRIISIDKISSQVVTSSNISNN